jgi:hypothetical protein
LNMLSLEAASGSKNYSLHTISIEWGFASLTSMSPS